MKRTGKQRTGKAARQFTRLAAAKFERPPRGRIYLSKVYIVTLFKSSGLVRSQGGASARKYNPIEPHVILHLVSELAWSTCQHLDAASDIFAMAVSLSCSSKSSLTFKAALHSISRS